MLIAKDAKVTPLLHKLSELDAGNIDEEWYRGAIWVLRGGDGGEHGLLLYKLVRRHSNCGRPLVIIDVGTARGFSAMTMARSLLDGNISGSVYSIDVIDHQESRFWHGKKNDAGEPLADTKITRAEIWSRWFESEAARVLPIAGRSVDILRTWSHGPIDVAFLDGSHTYQNVKGELSLLEPLMTDQGVIVLDDYHLGLSAICVRSQVLNAIAELLGRSLGTVWAPLKDLSPDLRRGNEFVVVKRRFGGIRKAVEEFLKDHEQKWTLEIVSMPPRGDYQSDDYSLALLTRR